MIKFLENIKNKRVLNVYLLTSKNNPDNILTICLHKSEAIHYAHMLLKEKYLHHYQMWCTRNGYDIDSINSWNIYFTDVISDSDKDEYVIKPAAYSYKNIAAILRMFAGCIPAGCDFEDDTEFEYAEVKFNMEKEYQELKNFWAENKKNAAEISDG